MINAIHRRESHVFHLTIVFAILALSMTNGTTIVSAQTPNSPVVIHDIQYVPGGDPAEMLDLYLPGQASAAPVPLIVVVHGGGWLSGDRSWESGQCMHWVGLGYAVANVEYRFSQKAVFPAQIQDCQAAVRWLRANSKKYHIDPRHFGATGGSAGGHLVALLGTSGGKHVFPPIGGNEKQSDRVQAVIDLYGPADFTTVCSQAIADKSISFGYNLTTGGGNAAYAFLIGVKQLDEDKAKAEAVSPVHYVSRDNPPFLILHGTADSSVPFAQSVELADDLQHAGVTALLQRVPNAGHGGPAFDLPPAWVLREAFFDKYLRHKNVEVALLPDSALTIAPAPSK